MSRVIQNFLLHHTTAWLICHNLERGWLPGDSDYLIFFHIYVHPILSSSFKKPTSHALLCCFFLRQWHKVVRNTPYPMLIT